MMVCDTCGSEVLVEDLDAARDQPCPYCPRGMLQDSELVE